jgi:hypothetical protein
LLVVSNMTRRFFREHLSRVESGAKARNGRGRLSLPITNRIPILRPQERQFFSKSNSKVRATSAIRRRPNISSIFYLLISVFNFPLTCYSCFCICNPLQIKLLSHCYKIEKATKSRTRASQRWKGGDNFAHVQCRQINLNLV